MVTFRNFWSGIKMDKTTQIKVKPHSYQPSKAELEETIDLAKPDGSIPSPDELATRLLQPVKIVSDKRS